MKIKINLEKRGHNSKPSKEAAIISDQVRQEGAQVELTPQELAEKIKHGFTFTPGVIGGNIDSWKPITETTDKEGNPIKKRVALENPLTGAPFCVSDFWQQMQIIAVDIDNETKHATNKYELTPAAALAACKAAGIDPYLIYKTFSYTPEHEKFRVLIILDAPITDFNKARDLISRFANLFNNAIAAEYEAAGITPEACADSSIEPVKLIFGGRDNCIFYQTDNITPTSTIEALPQRPTDAPRNAGNEKRQNNPPKYVSAAEAQNERDLMIAALFTIPPARLDYKEWQKIAAAAKYEGLDYDTFDRWCAQDTGTNDKGQPRYNEQGNYKAWQSFADPGQGRGANRTATRATIYYYAQIYGGWKFPPRHEHMSETEYKKIIADFDSFTPEQELSPADFPAGFFADAEEKAAADPEPIPAPAEDPNNIKSLEQTAPPAATSKPAPEIKSAAEYLRGGQYDADIEDLKQYAGRKMELHPDIDKYLTLYPGLAILGGQASLGKTTFCINVAAKLLERGEHVLYFALEQKSDELITKFAARYIYEQDKETAIDNIQLNQGARDSVTCEYLAVLSDKLKHLYIIDCDFETTAAEIVRQIELYIKTFNVKPIVIIDYLQIIAPPLEFHGAKMDYIDENLKTLKKWQKNNGLFILLISSFNRANNYDPVSYESFLYTSAIEFTCDYVFGLQLQILDYDNDEFYIRKGERGGEYENKTFEKRRKVQEAQSHTPKKVQFVSLKNRKGRQLFKANFDYYPAHDYFVPDYSQAWNPPHSYNNIFDKIKGL